MRILITGGFGYIGGRLARFLSTKSDCEIVLGTRTPREVLGRLRESKVVQMHWHSLDKLKRACVDVDMIVHSAGMNAQDCELDPVGALEFNGVATNRLLQAAIQQGAKRFVYLSTAHVYGRPLTGSITEDRSVRPDGSYATSHRAGEDVVLAAHRAEEIEGVVIRLSNAFGVPVTSDINCWMLLVNDLCKQAVTTGKMILRSSGSQSRDFVPLSYVCEAIEHLCRLPTSQLSKGIFNIGSGETKSVLEMAKSIQQQCLAVLGFYPELCCAPRLAAEELTWFDYNCELIRQTNFRCRIDANKEIDQLLKFCKTNFIPTAACASPK